MSVGAYFLGLCLWYDGKSRALTPIERESGLEYEISALAKRLSQKRRKLAFTVGRGERDLGTDYTFIKRALDPEIDVLTLDPATATIADDIAGLVVAGPRRPFDDRARGEIDRFLRSGRPAIFLLDGADAEKTLGNVERQIVRPIETGLEPLLAAYGFRIGTDLVLDPRNVPGPIGGDDPAVPPVFLNFPAFVAVLPRPRLPATTRPSPKESTRWSFRSPAPSNASGDRTRRRTRTSGRSAQLGGVVAAERLVLVQAAPPDGAARGPSVLAYAYQGPARESAANGGSASAAPSVRLVVVGGSSLVADRYMSLMRAFRIYAGGAELFLGTR